KARRSVTLTRAASPSGSPGLRPLWSLIRRSHPWCRDAALVLVLALAICVRGLAVLVALEEQHLGDALVGVDLGRQRRGVRDLEGHVALPLGLEGRDVGDEPAAGVG